MQPPEPPPWCGTRRVVFSAAAVGILLACGFLAGWYSQKSTIDDRCAIDTRTAAQKAWVPLPPYGSTAATALVDDPTTARECLTSCAVEAVSHVCTTGQHLQHPATAVPLTNHPP
jgi:hypothetical protein